MIMKSDAQVAAIHSINQGTKSYVQHGNDHKEDKRIKQMVPVMQFLLHEPIGKSSCLPVG